MPHNWISSNFLMLVFPAYPTPGTRQGHFTISSYLPRAHVEMPCSKPALTCLAFTISLHPDAADGRARRLDPGAQTPWVRTWPPSVLLMPFPCTDFSWSSWHPANFQQQNKASQYVSVTRWEPANSFSSHLSCNYSFENKYLFCFFFFLCKYKWFFFKTKIADAH